MMWKALVSGFGLIPTEDVDFSGAHSFMNGVLRGVVDVEDVESAKNFFEEIKADNPEGMKEFARKHDKIMSGLGTAGKII